MAPAAIRDPRPRAIPPHRPQIQEPRPPTSRAASSATIAVVPDRAEKTKSIQMTAPIMGKPMICRRVSIHGPGFGRRAMRRGEAERRRYGAAMPRASAVNTPKTTGKGRERA